MSNKPIFTLLGILIIGSINLAFINAVNNVVTLQESGAFGVKISKLEYEVYYYMTLIFGNHAMWAAYSTAILFLFSIGAYLNRNYDSLEKVSLIVAIALYSVCSYDYISHPVDIPENNSLGKFVYQNIYEFAGQSTAFIAWCVLTLTLFIFSLILLGYDVGSKADYLLSMIGYGFDSAKKKISNSFVSISKKELLGKGVTHTDHIHIIPDNICLENIPPLKPITRPATQVVKKDIIPVPVNGEKEVEKVNLMDTMVIPILTDHIKEKDGKTGNNSEALSGELISKHMRMLGIKGVSPIGLNHGPLITSYGFTLPGLQATDLTKIKSEPMLGALAAKLKLPANAIAFRTDEHGNFHYDILRRENDRHVDDFITFLKALRGPLENLDIEPRIKFPIPLGYGVDGKIIVVCMYTIKHLLCTGVSGCGKSNFLHMLIISQMRHAIKNNMAVDYYLIDVMGATSTVWEGFKAMKKIASTHLDAIELLNILSEKMRERNRVLNKMKAQDITVVNEKLMEQGLPQYPIIFLVIDEIALLVDKDRIALHVDEDCDDFDKDIVGAIRSIERSKKMVDAIRSQIAEIVKAGRKHGVYLMAFGTRVMRADIGSSTVTELTKIVFNTGGGLEARSSSGRSKAEVPANKLAPVGDAFFVGSRVIRFHTPSLGATKKRIDQNLKKWKDELNKKISEIGEN
jgi:hypothetical protein